MSLTLTIPEFVAQRRQPKNAAAVRVIPAPKGFVVPVTWKEVAAEPNVVPLVITPESPEPPQLVKSITRLRIPLELRLDPTL